MVSYTYVGQIEIVSITQQEVVLYNLRVGILIRHLLPFFC